MTAKYTIGPEIDLDEEIVLDANGRRITEARAVEIANETLVRVGAGRPSLTAPGQHSPEIKARVPRELRDRLRAAARERGTTDSDIIRQALIEYLAS